MTGIIGKEMKLREAVGLFPYGEWLILFLSILAWAKRDPARPIYYSLLVAWVVGKVIENQVGWPGTWCWHYGRLLVILVFWWWSWRRTGFKTLPVVVTTLGLATVQIFLLNKPGLVPFEEWVQPLAVLIIAGFLSSSFWEMTLVTTSAVLLNLGLVVFFYSGLLRYADLPDPLLWNLGVIFFAATGLYPELRARYASRKVFDLAVQEVVSSTASSTVNSAVSSTEGYVPEKASTIGSSAEDPLLD